jgi:hypothetical protein
MVQNIQERNSNTEGLFLPFAQRLTREVRRPHSAAPAAAPLIMLTRGFRTKCGIESALKVVPQI